MTDTPAQRQARDDSRARGWHVEYQRCGHTFLVYREEIMDGSWLRKCPAWHDGVEHGKDTDQCA